MLSWLKFSEDDTKILDSLKGVQGLDIIDCKRTSFPKFLTAPWALEGSRLDEIFLLKRISCHHQKEKRNLCWRRPRDFDTNQSFHHFQFKAQSLGPYRLPALYLLVLPNKAESLDPSLLALPKKSQSLKSSSQLFLFPSLHVLPKIFFGQIRKSIRDEQDKIDPFFCLFII